MISFWRNAFHTNQLLILSSILTTTASSSLSEIDGICQNRQRQNPLAIRTMSCARGGLKTSMADWAFAPNQTLLRLPIEDEKDNYVRREVPKVIFSQVYPTPLNNGQVKLVCTSKDAMESLLDMDNEEMPKNEDFVQWVAGNKVIKDSTPLSHRYGGHQFGYWASQLGDGRAILLGEYVNANQQRIELQLKGAGRTPYSRFGDGRAVLRSSIREFLCSEAMHYLGVPTSRAAAIVVSDQTVMRDIFYNGNAKPEQCAVVLRLASTWFRIGSLEILAKSSETKELNQLIDFLLEHHFQHVKQEDRLEWILAMFANIVDSTAQLVAKWMSVGFTHGVLNTDNLSLASITIDYGPFGFLDSYDPNFIPNHSDDSGRYDYESQPSICLWNLGKLATALTAVLPQMKHQQLQYILGGFTVTYKTEHTRLFCNKLGLSFDPNTQGDDAELIENLLEIFAVYGADFTQAFRDMSETKVANWLEPNEDRWGLAKLAKVKKFQEFIEKYEKRLAKENVDEDTRMSRMCKANPRYILRNWMAQKAIEKAEKEQDYSLVRLLLKVLTKPFDKQEEAEDHGFAKPVPDWSKDLVVSCSS